MSWIKRIKLNTFLQRASHQLKTTHYNHYSITWCASTSTKSKPKPKQKSIYQKDFKSKPKQKSKSSHLYAAPSLSDYVVNDKSNRKNAESGWKRTFTLCYKLLDHNPYGIKSMMNGFNGTSTATGTILFASIYACSYYSLYTFPASWFVAWITMRLFTDIFPLFAKLYYHLIKNYAFFHFPILKYLKFSRKLPDPEAQSIGSMISDRMNENQKLKLKKLQLQAGKQDEHIDDTDIESMHVTDEMIAKQSVLGSWKVRSRSHAKKYGLAWDIVENTSTLIVMPMFMCAFQVMGIGDPLIDVLLQNDNMISGFFLSNQWIIKLGVSYAVATYLNRLVAIPIFRYWFVPSYFKTFGPNYMHI